MDDQPSTKYSFSFHNSARTILLKIERIIG